MTPMQEPRITLPCVGSYTIIQTRRGCREREDQLIAGTWGACSFCTVLCFNTDPINDIIPRTAELNFSVRSLMACARRLTLFIKGACDTPYLTEICGPGPVQTGALGLLGPPPYGGIRRVTIRCEYPCGGFATLEKDSPAPYITVVTGIPPCRCNPIRIAQHQSDYVFFQSLSLPPVDTARAREFTFYVTNAGDAPFAADLETSADALHWVPDVHLNIQADETAALVAKFYGAFTRLRFSAEGESKALVRFIGQYYG